MHAVEAVAFGVGDQPGDGLREVEVEGAVVEEGGGTHDLTGLERVAELQRDRPLRVVVLVREVLEPLLGEVEPPAVRAHVDAHDGMTALQDPRVHDPADRLAGGLLDGVPQIGGLGVAVLVGGHVLADAGAELRFAEVLLEHPHHGGALLVGEHVEHPLGVGGRHHRVLDRASRLQRVGVEGGGPRQAEAHPPLPLGAEGVGDLHLHEGGEGLVEPDAVPPLHRDQVAEPHVGELVGDHVDDVLQLALRGVLGVGEEEGLPEGDAAEVLHRAEREVGDRHEVHGVAGIGDVEVVGQVAQREVGDLQTRSAVRWSFPGGQRIRSGVPSTSSGFGDLERPDDEGHQVGGHRDRLREPHPALPVEHLVGLDGGVRHRVELLVEEERDREPCLEVGFVPAREGPTGIGGLELRGGDHPLDAVVVGEGRPVEAAQLVVEETTEAQRHHRVARRELVLQRERDPLRLLVDRDGGRPALATDLDPGPVDLQARRR